MLELSDSRSFGRTLGGIGLIAASLLLPDRNETRAPGGPGAPGGTA